MFLFFQDPIEYIDTALKVTPFTALGYSFAVLVITFVAYVFYKRWLSAENYIRELNKVNTDAYHANLKEYVGSLTIIKENLREIKETINRQ